MRILRYFLPGFLAATAAVAVYGQNTVQEFVKGPAQWLMTAEEKKAWIAVKTEDQAKDLADLFFARRDPTPGTYPNEFRAEFNRRVDYADKNFKETRKRGALTERGRVLITLGFAKNMAANSATRAAQNQGASGGEGGGAGSDPTGGRTMAARDVWEYERVESLKYGMPKIEVIFLHDGFQGSVRRDPQRTDFTSALPSAIKYYIRNPELTSVPEWAKVAALQTQTGQASGATERTETVTTYDTVTKQTVVDVAPAKATRPAGAGKLTLIADAFAIQPQTAADPFATLVPLTAFRRDQELGWAAEYCTGDVATPVNALEVTMKISGLIKGEKVNYNSPAEEMEPDQIKAVPGCYLVRGAVPLSDMDPGNYVLFIKIGSYNLTREFKVE